MNVFSILNSTSYNLSSIDHCKLGKEWDYKNIISPFSRLYLITEGEGFIQIGETSVKLKKGYLYLIPSYIQCTYKCPEFMEQYYATFSINLPNNLSIYLLYRFKNEIKAAAHHYEYFKELCEINKGMGLPTGNPKVYQKQMKLGINRNIDSDASDILKSAGILNLFLSEFIEGSRMKLSNETDNHISSSIKYIHLHLHENITIAHLAKSTYMSPDHFTRKFKELTAQTPLDYINKQRIETSLMLLNTTSNSITDIAHQCGFSSTTSFGKVFRKYIHQAPREYKNNLTNEFNPF
ncbi:helix-turn-helix domain-containing protein [Labilibacter marinus]|uniref:helix-turn-helix domain-containing protein n=1 Tax=Labilibacter marinus TaxID=1477105 RepID=UPI00094FCE42|nr:AraC family transcriptional regulator [Labilibacter marinus]